MIWILILAAVFLAVLLVPVNVVFEYENGTSFYFKVLFFRFRPHRGKGKPAATAEESRGQTAPGDGAGKLKKVLEHRKEILELADYAAKHCIAVKQLSVKIAFGTGDAAATGIAAGALNALVYTAVSVVHHSTLLKKWDVSIDPDFEQEKFDAHLLCICTSRGVHIISMAAAALMIYKRIKKTEKENERK